MLLSGEFVNQRGPGWKEEMMHLISASLVHEHQADRLRAAAKQRLVAEARATADVQVCEERAWRPASLLLPVLAKLRPAAAGLDRQIGRQPCSR